MPSIVRLARRRNRTFLFAVDFDVFPIASFAREFDRGGRGFEDGSREGAGTHAGPRRGAEEWRTLLTDFDLHEGTKAEFCRLHGIIVIVLARQVWDSGLCRDRGA